LKYEVCYENSIGRAKAVAKIWLNMKNIRILRFTIAFPYKLNHRNAGDLCNNRACGP